MGTDRHLVFRLWEEGTYHPASSAVSLQEGGLETLPASLTVASCPMWLLAQNRASDHKWGFVLLRQVPCMFLIPT